MKRVVQGLGIASLFAGIGCHSLDVENPNAPDNTKLLADPNSVESLAGGSLRGWYNSWEGLTGNGPLVTQARTYSASWNNAWMNYHSSVDNPGNPATTGYNPTATWNRFNRPFQNNPVRTERTTVEWFWTGGTNEWAGDVWPGVYSGYASANTALRAIRGGLTIRGVDDTKRAETIAMLGRGLALMLLAIEYDSAFVIDENTDLTTVQPSGRKGVRDAAVAQLQAVMDSAAKYSFTTEGAWMNGHTYTNDQIRRVAATAAALTLAYYPRDNAEAATQVNWGQVITFASQGMSTGTAFDFIADGDGCVTWCPEILGWFDDLGSGRVSTRVAYLLDPATQTDPYPNAGNPQPNSADRRLGDGSFGTGSLTGSRKTPIKTANAGTDFAWSNVGSPFRPDRGQYHQTNIGHIRYDASGNHAGDGIIGAFGPAPALSATQNDLIWAEALLRSGGSALTAAQLIDKTRVGRGNLSPSAVATVAVVGSDADGPCTSTNVLSKGGACTLWGKLLYEKEIEVLGLGPSSFYEQRHLPFISTCGSTPPCNGRHVAGLLPGTPREMPVPAKELLLKQQALYTYGGTGAANSAP